MLRGECHSSCTHSCCRIGHPSVLYSYTHILSPSLSHNTLWSRNIRVCVVQNDSSLAPSLTHTHTHTHIHTHTHTLSLPHIVLSLPRSHTHIHRHTYIHTHTLSLSRTLRQQRAYVCVCHSTRTTSCCRIGHSSVFYTYTHTLSPSLATHSGLIGDNCVYVVQHVQFRIAKLVIHLSSMDGSTGILHTPLHCLG